MHLHKLELYAERLGIAKSKPSHGGLKPSRQLAILRENTKKERCRLVMSCVLLKTLEFSDLEVAHNLFRLSKSAFRDRTPAHFLITFPKEALNLKELSPDAQSWYSCQLLCSCVNEACLEDATVMTLQHITKTSTDVNRRSAALLGLEYMTDYCLPRWQEEGAKCVITYKEEPAETVTV